jgi:osmotically-inducible protein OsmY
MFFSMMRAVLLIVFLAGAAVVLLGWWGVERFRSATQPAQPATSTAPNPDADDRARQIGAQVGERAGAGAATAGRALADGSVTAKIKAKLALDDAVRARDIDVDTTGTTVTVSGTVRSAAEQQRVLQLARDTEGVTEVIDRIRVAP